MTTLSIYACGGAGINLVKDFVNLDNPDNVPFFPTTKKYALDTSDSNIRTLPSDVRPFLVPGLRGAGKKRQQAFHGVSDHIAGILNEHKPSDFNLVMFSASGGSGSVLGPLVLGELLKRGAATCCIVVGSTSSSIETQNTIKTLQTLQSMATGKATGGRPVMMVYQENDTSFTGDATEGYRAARPKIDDNVEGIVRMLGMLFSGSHHGLDYTDLVNWLDHTRNFDTIPSQLIEILPFKQEFGGIPKWQGEQLERSYEGNVIGVASLLTSDGDEIPSLSQPYTCDGYYEEQVWGAKQPPNFHFVTTTSRLPRIFGSLEMAAQNYDSARRQLEGTQVVGQVGDADADTGMVF